MDIRILRYETIDSTNTAALEQARRGAEEGLVIIASEQTAGRGRHGRKWHSSAGDGLYFSLLLRPKIEPTDLPILTLMAGVATHDALEEFVAGVDLKWVNDLLVGGRKIGGILAETTDTPRGPAVVVGIGLNLRQGHFPPELNETATSIERETGNPPDSAAVETALVRYLLYYYQIMQESGGPAAIRNEWQRRSSYANGMSVCVKTDGQTIKGVTAGLESDGALRIATETGIIALRAGDVERLRPMATSGQDFD